MPLYPLGSRRLDRVAYTHTEIGINIVRFVGCDLSLSIKRVIILRFVE